MSVKPQCPALSDWGAVGTSDALPPNSMMMISPTWHNDTLRIVTAINGQVFVKDFTRTEVKQLIEASIADLLSSKPPEATS